MWEYSVISFSNVSDPFFQLIYFVNRNDVKDIKYRENIYLAVFYCRLGYMQPGISGSHCGGHLLKDPLI